MGGAAAAGRGPATTSAQAHRAGARACDAGLRLFANGTVHSTTQDGQHGRGCSPGPPRTTKGIAVMSDPYLAIQVVMMPRDTNPHGTIFGGVILSYLDQAGALGARREVVRAGGPLPVLVTVAINRVEFRQPVLVGDVVRFLTRLVRIGRTSVTVHINVEAERAGQTLQVTEAEAVYVAVDATGPERRPVPLLP